MQRVRIEALVRNRPVWLGAGGLVIVAAVVIAASHPALITRRFHETQSGSPISAFALQQDPKPIAKAETTPTDTDSQNQSAGTPPAAIDSKGKAALPLTKPAPDNNTCDEDMPSAVNAYNHVVQKEKNLLDSTLSFRVGLNISSQYVADYNNKVTSLFNEYQDEANDKNCTWPVKEPTLLPLNYSL